MKRNCMCVSVMHRSGDIEIFYSSACLYSVFFVRFTKIHNKNIFIGLSIEACVSRSMYYIVMFLRRVIMRKY